MKLYQNITVDLFKPYPLPVMNVQQNNQGHVAVVTLTAGGTILNPADETLTAWAKKKDGTVSYIECEYDAGKVKVELTNQMLALDGQLQVELQVVSESCNITTPIFIVCVGKSNISDKAIKSQNEFTVLQNKIKEVRTLSEYMTTLTGGQVASASLASEMTDTEMIYLYVGTEKGYINGSWYYYDSKNAAWISSITNGDVSRYFNSVSTDTLTWNGITTGLVTDDGGIWYKVSDDMPTIEDADTGVINWIAYNGTENERSFRGAYVSGDDLSAMAYRTYNTDETVYVIADLDNFYVAVVTQDGGTYNNRTFPETGTYFWGATLTVSSFTIDGFNGFTTEQLRYECTPPKVIDKLNQLSYEVELANENVSNLSEEIDDLKENGVGSSIEPADDDIPKVYFTGTLPTSKDDGNLPVTIHYKSKTEEFDYYATLKVQGSSSASYPKKNFTLKMYEDEALENKVKYAFKNWGKLNKWVLKAHWIDHSHVRNVGTAKIWGKIVASRSDYDSLPEELRNAPNNGATDGFTVKVFANGVYQGLYEWIVPKDKLFGQDSDIATHSIMNSELNNQPTCAFATTAPTINGNWSEELQDDLSSSISTSFANFIKFVAGSTDEEFVANAENYFDVQSVIDFDIFARVFCIVDNLCRNQIFFTYDGTKWYEGCWDVDAVLGLPPTTRGFFAYNTEFQTGYVAYKDYGITNLLYQRVENLFLDRFKERYNELRSSVLSIENILDVYERLMDVIKTYDGLLEEDCANTTGGGKFIGIPYTSENKIQQIRSFVAQRIPYMDEVVASMTEPVPCTGITLSSATLTFTEEGSQTLTATVTPSDCTEGITWASDNTSIAIVEDGVVTAVANGSATITATCGDYSASCSVSVSGIAEPVACTGITLNYTELSLTSEGETKTITATVTPTDTTDSITWKSSNEAVAIVDNGIVTAIFNGTTNITATCGDYTATCIVTVSGITTMNLTLTQGYALTNGVVTATNNNNYTTIEVIGVEVSAEYLLEADASSIAVAMYNTDGSLHMQRGVDVGATFEAETNSIRVNAYNTSNAPSYCKLKKVSDATYTSYTFECDTTLADATFRNKRYINTSGMLVVSGGETTYAIDQYVNVTAGKTYTFTTPSTATEMRICFFKEDKTCIGSSYSKTISSFPAEFTVPDTCSFIRFHVIDSAFDASNYSITEV